MMRNNLLPFPYIFASRKFAKTLLETVENIKYARAVESEKYQATIEELKDKEYDRAKADIAMQLRALLVDANYELFHSSDAFLRNKVYAFMSTALAAFHEKAFRR